MYSQPLLRRVCKVLECMGIRTLFGMVGEGVGILEGAAATKAFKIYTARDQRVAVGMAMGYAQSSCEPAVYIASPGPGITNSLNGILEAYSASVPIIFMTYGTARNMRGKGAFQELDAVDLLKPITKWAYRIEHEDKLEWAIQRAVHLSINGNQGPVFVEIPSDLTLDGPRADAPLNLRMPKRQTVLPPMEQVEELARMLAAAERPAIIVGGGCRSNMTVIRTLLEKLSRLTSAALFSTASGRGVINEFCESYYGLVGLYLLGPSKELLSESDFCLVIGSKLEETALIGWKDHASNTVLARIDLDVESFHKSIPNEYPIWGDAACTLKLLCDIYAERFMASSISRIRWESRQKKARQLLNKLANVPSFEISPVRRLLYELRSVLTDRTSVIVQENGLNDIWGYCYPILRLGEHTKTFVPGEQTVLGLQLGVGVGVKLFHRDALAIVIVGDGAFEIGHHAVTMAAEYRLGMIFVVLNNHGLGWPKYMQTTINKGKEIGCEAGKQLSVKSLADSINGAYYQPNNDEELRDALHLAVRNADDNRVSLIEVELRKQELPWPLIELYGEET